jgi:hypothetical protein
MQMDHTAETKKYAAAAEQKHIDAIVKHLGIAMKGTDSQLVSCSSKDELARVRDSWCKKKLALAHTDAELDKVIQEVCTTMKADKNKSRVAFYYLLAHKTGKLAALAA